MVDAEVVDEGVEETSEKTIESREPSIAARPVITTDESHAHATYANFCRVTGTPEELIIDFGLNSQPMGIPTEPLKIDQRLVINYYTAKRLLGALQMSIQRHEGAFGVLETDVQKRVMPGLRRQAAR